MEQTRQIMKRNERLRSGEPQKNAIKIENERDPPAIHQSILIMQKRWDPPPAKRGEGPKMN